MAATQSRWREIARRVIRETLADVPANADDKTKRARLKLAYPFGPREHHPYKIWCDEVRRVLKPAKPKTGKLNIVVEISPKPWLEEQCLILCGWCDGRGCLMCDGARREAVANARYTDWKLVQAFVDAVRREPSPVNLGAFADWLAENGWPELSRHYAARVKVEG